jgi:hypothetical protein
VVVCDGNNIDAIEVQLLELSEQLVGQPARLAHARAPPQMIESLGFADFVIGGS